MADATAAAPNPGAAPPVVLSADNVSPEAALASIRAAEKILAQHRVKPLQSIVDKIKAADLKTIAAEIVAVLANVTSEQDRALMQNDANVFADAERRLTSVLESNTALASA